MPNTTQDEPSWKKYEDFTGPNEAERTAAMQEYRRSRGWSSTAGGMMTGGSLRKGSPNDVKHKKSQLFG